MRKCENLVDRIFGRLKVIKADKDKRNRTVWLCECSCDDHNLKIAIKHDLVSGRVKSCGCLLKETAGERLRSHGMTKTRLYQIYNNMKNRCNNPLADDYKYYGGREIKICDEWLNDFMNFYNWSMQKGYSDELTLDRKDVNGNYEPNNCRWATMVEQQNNKTINIIISHDEKERTLTQWSREKEINPTAIHKRIAMGWDETDLFNPIRDEAERQSGVRGVTWNRGHQAWSVRIWDGKKIVNIGKYDSLDVAIKVRSQYPPSKRELKK